MYGKVSKRQRVKLPSKELEESGYWRAINPMKIP
jgi:hypothetical protein